MGVWPEEGKAWVNNEDREEKRAAGKSSTKFNNQVVLTLGCALRGNATLGSIWNIEKKHTIMQLILFLKYKIFKV